MQENAPPERLEVVQEDVLVPPEVERPPAPDDLPPQVVAPAVTFDALYREAFPEMVRLAYLLTGSEETARDVVQDSFLRLHGAWDRARDRRAYLRRMVINACHSHHRRARRQREHLARQRVEPVTFAADEMFDAIAGLPYRQRAAVVLRYWHDCTQEEIATALGCRSGTAGSLIHRALAELRKVMP